MIFLLEEENLVKMKRKMIILVRDFFLVVFLNCGCFNFNIFSRVVLLNKILLFIKIFYIYRIF